MDARIILEELKVLRGHDVRIENRHGEVVYFVKDVRMLGDGERRSEPDDDIVILSSGGRLSFDSADIAYMAITDTTTGAVIVLENHDGETVTLEVL